MISFLFLDTERVWRGGQHQLFTLLKGLLQRRHEVRLICHPGTLLEERAREIGVTVLPLRVRSELGVISFCRLVVLMRRLRPDIVAFNTPRSILLGSVASRFAGIRARIVFRRVSFPLGKNPITRLKYNWGIDCIVAISESIRHQLESAGVPASRIRLVYEGLDLANYPKHPSAGRQSLGKPMIVGTVASLSQEKGHYYLVEAASRIPDVCSRMRFVFVGDGDHRKKLEEQVRLRGLEGCFQFAGFQSRTLDYFRFFDVFVLPSLSEGLSSAILSAMASSLPVVATEVGGIPELVRHGENGLLVPAADAVALAQAITRVAENPAEAMQMGLRGRERVEQEFTLERKILQTEELCSTFLHRPAPVPRTAHA